MVDQAEIDSLYSSGDAYDPTTITMPVPLQLPIISIIPYLSPDLSADGAARRSCAEAIHRACRDIGFFYLKVDDYLPRREMEEVLKLGKGFFDRPEEEKEEINIEKSDGARGEDDQCDKFTSQHDPRADKDLYTCA